MKTLRKQAMIGPFRTDACQLVTPYVCFCVPVIETITVNVPEVSANACGFGTGMSFGFHF
jgi:hypothetical protein